MSKHDPDNLQDVLQHLSHLEPTAADQPTPPKQALMRLQQQLSLENETHTAVASAPHPSFLTRLTRRFQTMFSKQYAPRWAALSLVAALLMAVITIPSARALASDFLGLFRVQKFAPISIDPAQLERLEELELEGLFPGELTMLEEPGDPTAVGTLANAASTAGYTPKTVTNFGDPDEVLVATGGAGILTVDLENARAILEIADIDPTLLPDSIDGQEINVTTYNSVMQNWEDELHFMQSPAPEVAYPAGFDPAPIGQALLQFVGLSEAEAIALSQSIDWTSTLVVPVPSTVATFTEVSINGHPGLFLRAIDGPELGVMWQADGYLYSMVTDTLGDDALLNAAESVE